MNASINEIQNAHFLTDIFGRFPSFHDSEVLTVTLDRGEKSNPSLEAIVHLFEMTSAVDANGGYVLKNHVLVHFCFSKIKNLELNDFNLQNVLHALHFEPCFDLDGSSSGFKVIFEGIYGMHATFECESVSIESVEPYSS
jgi:hypothetical protein